MLLRRRLWAGSPGCGGLLVELLHRNFGGLGRVESAVEAAPWVAKNMTGCSQRPRTAAKSTDEKIG